MKHHRIVNYRLFLLYSSIVAFAAGLFMPFYIVFIQGFGKSLETFGIAIGLMALAGAITSYFVGSHSDILGRKIFLVIAGFLTSAIIIAYTFITSLWQLYVLQILNGAIQAMEGTMTATLLADITVKVSRGADVGRLHAVTGMIAAFAVMGGGFLAGRLGIHTIFYITAALIFIGTLAIFYIKEK